MAQIHTHTTRLQSTKSSANHLLELKHHKYLVSAAVCRWPKFKRQLVYFSLRERDLELSGRKQMATHNREIVISKSADNKRISEQKLKLKSKIMIQVTKARLLFWQMLNSTSTIHNYKNLNISRLVICDIIRDFYSTSSVYMSFLC